MPDVPTRISGCVITFQEEDRIADCLQSLKLCDELLVVDSGSTDRTLELAELHGARIVVNAPFPGMPEQRQFAVDRASHDWVLCLDADERLSPELQERITELRTVGLRGAAYETPRRNRYLGKLLRRGLSWPDRKVRLFNRGYARCGGHNPHDRIEVLEGGEVTVLQEPIDHLSYRNFAHHLRVVDSFSTIAARTMWQQGRRASALDILRPPAVAFKSLVLKLGFLDGWRGLLIACMAGYYDWLKYWRLFQLRRCAPGDP